MGNRQKADQVRYDVCIEGFQRLYSNWGQKFKFLMMLNSV
jgi:hypothetical protein